MTAAAHTPGPWDWFMSARGEAMLATPDRGRLLVMQPVRCGMQGGTVRFAEWGGGERGRRGGVMLEAKEYLRDGVLMHPDAHLIAAAPDLLAALRKTAETLRFACLAITDHDALGYALEQVTAANAAIARAEGRPA